MSGHDTFAVRRTHRGPSANVDGRIQYILRVIESQPSSGSAALARMVNLSPSRLSHLFKHETRHSLHRFLANRRLEKGAHLLAATQTPVKEVSYIVGYSHSASFVRAFRKRFGCTPNRYRANSDFAIENSCFG